MSPRRQSNIPEVDIGEAILVESLQEFFDSNSLVEEYEKLKEKCDSVIGKIKARKKREEKEKP